eukprot:941750-Lingulodinium_polyedra.AAC.1
MMWQRRLPGARPRVDELSVPSPPSSAWEEGVDGAATGAPEPRSSNAAHHWPATPRWERLELRRKS